MARRRVAQEWAGPRREEHLDGMFGAMQVQAQQALGMPVSIGTEIEAFPVGLPLPSLCLRYLYQSTVFPLSRIIQLTGEEGTAKSAKLYEILRWHLVYGGGGVVIENEGKDAPELRASLYAWNATWLRRIEVIKTFSLEQCQDALTQTMKIARAQQDHPDGPGRTVPIAWGIDSIMGTAPQSEIDAVLKDGHASRGWAVAANLIARYMRTMPEQLKNYPFTVIGTNHLKPATDFMGRPTANIPGGKAVKFMESYEVEMSRAPNCDIDNLECGGLRLVLKTRKCSLGQSRRHIRADLLWWWQADEHGVMRQQTVWDWDTATIELLLRFENEKGKKTIYTRLQEIVDVNVTSKTTRMCWSNALGIPRDNPVPYRQAGATLEEHPELLAQMYPILGITPRRPFQPGLDYRDLLSSAQAEATAESRMLYSNVTAMPQVAGIESADDEEDIIEPDAQEE